MTAVKLLTVALLPIGLLMLVLVASMLARRLAARMLVVLCLVFAWLLSTPATARFLSDRAEQLYPPRAESDMPFAQAIVVLGGGVAYPGPGDSVRPGPEAGRAWYGARLLHAGKAPLLVISGGGQPPEADRIGQLLQAWSVPPERTILENRSRSTRQNALEVKGILAAKGIEQILLVTSSPHMPRAAAAFQVVGFDVSAFSVPFLAPPSADELALAAWLPTARGLDQTTTLLLEGLGRLYYRFRGWN